MAGGSYFEVEARVVAPGIVAKIAALIEEPARQIERRLEEAIRNGLSGSGIRAGVQGSRAGRDFGDAFARTTRTRIDAALRSLPDIKLNAYSGDVDREIFRIREQLAAVGKNIELGVDDKAALAEIEHLRRELSALARNNPDVRVRVNTGTALVELEALKHSINGFDQKGRIGRYLDDLRAKSRVANSALNGIGSTTDFVTGLSKSQVLIGAIIAALTTVGPLVAALSAGLLGAAGAAGVAALAVLGIKKQMADQVGFGQKISESFKGIAAEARGLADIAANAIGPAIADVLGNVKRLFPGFEGLVQIVGGRLGGAFREIGNALLTLFQKAGPLIVDVAGYIEQGAAAFNRWIVSDSFSHFLAYARQQLPILLGYAKDFGKALVDLFVAAAPAGEVVLKILDYIAKGLSFLAKIKPVSSGGFGVLSGLIGGKDDKKNVDDAADSIDNLLKSTTALLNGGQDIRSGSLLGPLDNYAKILPGLSDKVLAASAFTGDLATAVSNVDTRLRAATPALSDFIDAASKYDATTAKAADTAGLLGAALTASRGNALDYAAAMLGADTATQDFAKTLHDNIKSVAKDGTLLGVSHLDAAGKFVDASNKYSAGSAAIVSAFQTQVKAATDAATATYTNELATKGQAKAAADSLTVYKGYRQSLIDSAVAQGTARDKAKALADQYFAIPKNVDTFVSLLGQNNVALAISGLTTALNRLSDLIAAPQVALNSTAFDNAMKIKNSDLDYFGNRKPIPSLDLSTGAFNGKAAAANGVLDVLDRKVVGPTVNLNDFASYKLRGIQGLLLGLHDKTIYVNTVTGGHTAPGSARGNIFDSVRAYAGGGIEDHSAKIYSAVKPFRIFAEPETGGEAYIPLANDSRRARAESILTNVAGRFGMQVLPRDVARIASAAVGGGSGATQLVGTFALDAGSVGVLTGTMTGVAQGAIAQDKRDSARQSVAGTASVVR